MLHAPSIIETVMHSIKGMMLFRSVEMSKERLSGTNFSSVAH